MATGSEERQAGQIRGVSDQVKGSFDLGAQYTQQIGDDMKTIDLQQDVPAISVLTLRDFFATFAAIGLANAHTVPSKTAALAYDVADAMLIERARERAR